MSSNITNSSVIDIKNLLNLLHSHNNANSTSITDEFNTGMIVVLSFIGFIAVILVIFILYIKIEECLNYRQYLKKHNKVVPIKMQTSTITKLDESTKNPNLPASTRYTTISQPINKLENVSNEYQMT